MIKTLRKLKNKKGFTLVECVIAIAVFAIMTSMVLMIMANAQTQAKYASEAEGDLNNLIKNVVGDDTNKKYDQNRSEVLKLEIGGNPLAITYSKVDGNKNWIVCPGGYDDPDPNAAKCGYTADSINFIPIAYSAAVTNEMELRQAFLLTDLHYECPQCHKQFYQELECEACFNTGLNNDSSKFRLDESTGNYYCLDCGSPATKGTGRFSVSGSIVTGKSVNSAATGTSGLSITGIYPDGIKYGNVETPADPEVLVSITDNTGGGRQTGEKVEANFATPVQPDAVTPHTYTVTFYNLQVHDPATGNIVNYASAASPGPRVLLMTVPGGYEAKNLKVTSGGGEVAFFTNDNIKVNSNPGYIVVSGINSGAAVTIQFQLVNYKSGISFDTDYNAEGGLIKQWFGITGSNVQHFENK